MSAHVSGRLNDLSIAHSLEIGRPAAAVEAKAAASDSGAERTSIAANDFLTLLVTEMKNQDPTAQTDPNEYVNQLVQVNSLEQLISINETLQTGLGVSSSHTTRSHSAATDSSLLATPAASKDATALTPAPIAAGNLAQPRANADASQVAKALAPSAVR